MTAYFVVWNAGNDDPLDKGVEWFCLYTDAEEFAEKMTSKGIATTIYHGKIMPNEYQVTFKDFPNAGL